MRDRVSSKWFLWKKKRDVLLHKLLPTWYLPLYTLVTFTTTPYADARRRARLQERLLGLGTAGAILALIVLIYFLVKP
jgi:kynurenine 3-monooxygenase